MMLQKATISHSKNEIRFDIDAVVKRKIAFL